MSRHLGDMPSYLVRPATTCVELKTIAPEDNKCSTCWRTYDTIEDASNPTEKACHPLLLKACQHIIGRQCLLQQTSRNMMLCSLCRASIVQESVVSGWIIKLLNRSGPISFDYYSSSTLKRFSERPEDREWHTEHLDSIIAGNEGYVEASYLWAVYMDFPSCDTIASVFFLAGSWMGGWLLSLLPNPVRSSGCTYTEAVGDVALTVFLLARLLFWSTWPVLGAMEAPEWLGWAWFFSLVVGGQDLRRLGGTWGVSVIMSIPMMIYVGLVGRVLWAGRRGWRQRGW